MRCCDLRVQAVEVYLSILCGLSALQGSHEELLLRWEDERELEMSMSGGGARSYIKTLYDSLFARAYVCCSALREIGEICTLTGRCCQAPLRCNWLPRSPAKGPRRPSTAPPVHGISPRIIPQITGKQRPGNVGVQSSCPIGYLL